MVQFYSNNATNLHSLNFRQYICRVAPQHRDRIVSTDYCDVASLITSILVNENVTLVCFLCGCSGQVCSEVGQDACTSEARRECTGKNNPCCPLFKKIMTKGKRCFTRRKPHAAAEMAGKCRFLSLVTLTFDVWPWPSNSSERWDQTRLSCELGANPFSGSRDILTQTENNILTAPKTEPSAVHGIR